MHFMPCAALALVYTLITLTFLWQSLPGGSITGLTIGKYLHRQLQMEVHGKQRLVSGDQFAKCDFRGGLRTFANFSSDEIQWCNL